MDDLGRPVNAKGYLIDEYGNIINCHGTKIFNFWELIHLEPPKIFKFTEFSITWIKGKLFSNKPVLMPNIDKFWDIKGRVINTLYYLIDDADNIVDQYGNLVFNRDILSNYKG